MGCFRRLAWANTCRMGVLVTFACPSDQERQERGWWGTHNRDEVRRSRSDFARLIRIIVPKTVQLPCALHHPLARCLIHICGRVDRQHVRQNVNQSPRNTSDATCGCALPTIPKSWNEKSPPKTSKHSHRMLQLGDDDCASGNRRVCVRHEQGFGRIHENRGEAPEPFSTFSHGGEQREQECVSCNS